METEYALGASAAELARLDAQAAALAPATQVLLRTAGIEPGMRVLELGTGLGHVAFELAAIVGERGEVVAVDSSPAHLAQAEKRRTQKNVRFIEADARTYDGGRFDAVVARLLFFHLPEPLATLRHHAQHAGRLVVLDFDVSAIRSEPPHAQADELTRWLLEAFMSVGADPTIGTKLPRLLAEAGLHDIGALALQRAYAPGDPGGVNQLKAVIASLNGPSTDGLEPTSTVFIPALIGAWGTT
jgi:cyclopropane fatty-acyl-phospholipid synthase-like methyltransferase